MGIPPSSTTPPSPSELPGGTRTTGRDGAVTSSPGRGGGRAACCSLAAWLCSVTQHSLARRSAPPSAPPAPPAPHDVGQRHPTSLPPSPGSCPMPGGTPPARVPPLPGSCTAPRAAAPEHLAGFRRKDFNFFFFFHFIYLFYPWGMGLKDAGVAWENLGVFKAIW